MAEASQQNAKTSAQAPQERHPLWDGSWPLSPFLFAIASVVVMMARNLDHTSVADIAPSLAGATGFVLVVYLFVSALRRRFDRLSAIIASIWVVGCLFYAGLFGRLNGLLDGGYPMIRSLPVALVILGTATLLAFALRRAAVVVHSVLTGIAAVLLVNPVWEAASYEWQNGSARAAYDPDQAMAAIEQHLPPEQAIAAGTRPPDIYHFVFDRYTSEEVLRRYFELDNGAIGRFLEERGFFVAHASNSNYLKTGHSLASTFYMDYLDLLEDDERVQGSNWHPIYKMLGDHRVARILKARGYDIVQFGSWWVGTYSNPLADENRPHGFSEFEMLYLRRTVLRPLFHALPDMPLTMRLDWDNAQCQRVGPQVEEIKAIGERERPVYVFAHFLVPHGPFPFAADGNCLTQEEQARRGNDQGYLDQIAYANRIIEDIVTTLQRPDRTPPVILIQSDEGPFPKRDGRIPWQDASPDDLRIKTGILNAFFFPNRDYSALRQDITPVNSFRILFNTYFGTSFPLLTDRIFAFPNDATLYELHDVTEKVRGPATVAGRPNGHPLHP